MASKRKRTPTRVKATKPRARAKVTPKKKRAPKRPITPRGPRNPNAGGARARKASPKKPRGVKLAQPILGLPFKPATKTPPTGPRAVTHAQPTLPKPTYGARGRVLSDHPEAIRSRKRRAELRAIADAVEAERERKRVERKRHRQAAAQPPSIYELAVSWLEHIRNAIASEVFPVSLTLTAAEAGASMPWIVVGRFDPQIGIGYAQLAEAFSLLAEDYILEAKIHPQRTSQIRIVYADPKAKRGEGDSIVSKIGAWTYVLGDLLGEILGAGSPDDPGEESLAERYAATTIPTFYIYFSTEILQFTTVGPWAKAPRTATIQLR